MLVDIKDFFWGNFNSSLMEIFELDWLHRIIFITSWVLRLFTLFKRTFDRRGWKWFNFRSLFRLLPLKCIELLKELLLFLILLLLPCNLSLLYFHIKYVNFPTYQVLVVPPFYSPVRYARMGLIDGNNAFDQNVKSTPHIAVCNGVVHSQNSFKMEM